LVKRYMISVAGAAEIFKNRLETETVKRESLSVPFILTGKAYSPEKFDLAEVLIYIRVYPPPRAFLQAA